MALTLHSGAKGIDVAHVPVGSRRNSRICATAIGIHAGDHTMVAVFETRIDRVDLRSRDKSLIQKLAALLAAIEAWLVLLCRRDQAQCRRDRFEKTPRHRLGIIARPVDEAPLEALNIDRVLVVAEGNDGAEGRQDEQREDGADAYLKAGAFTLRWSWFRCLRHVAESFSKTLRLLSPGGAPSEHQSPEPTVEDA